MTYLRIEPVELVTTGGYAAEIYGIDPASSDCLIGKINTEYGGTAMWDLNGTCRDNSAECNLNTSSDEFVELDRIARALVNAKYL